MLRRGDFVPRSNSATVEERTYSDTQMKGEKQHLERVKGGLSRS